MLVLVVELLVWKILPDTSTRSYRILVLDSGVGQVAGVRVRVRVRGRG
jgi:hypothetical protein